MKLVKSSVEILNKPEDPKQPMKLLEEIARVCYKSENKITEDGSSAEALLRRIIKFGHEAMIEHYSLSVKFICSRGISHEIVRHRIASFAQESQRYCNYSIDKFDNELTFVVPKWAKAVLDCDTTNIASLINNSEITPAVKVWLTSCQQDEDAYLYLVNQCELTAQEAREVLPNSAKTEIVKTSNLREWRHFLDLRCDKAAHPDMQILAKDLLKQMYELLPVIFEDLYNKYIINEDK